MSELNIIPVLKKQDDTYDFCCHQKGAEGKVLAEYFVYLKEGVVIGYVVNSKAWEYHAAKEDPKLGLMVWTAQDNAWKRVNESITKAYNDFTAEKALLGPDEPKKQETAQQELL
jgi:hypothetical protein